MSDEESKGVAVASLFETEADASEDEAVSADEADDAEEGGGGIGVRDADDSEDGESSDEGPNPRKRRLRRAADVAIDEDELALLRENYRDGDVLGDDRSAKRARRGSADGEGGAVVAPSASTAAELAGALFTGGGGRRCGRRAACARDAGHPRPQLRQRDGRLHHRRRGRRRGGR